MSENNSEHSETNLEQDIREAIEKIKNDSDEMSNFDEFFTDFFAENSVS